MSQEFRGLPPAFGANQEDELLLVNPTSPTRISVKSLRYDSLATLKFKHPADQSYAIGTANTWVNLPFNELTLTSPEQWVQLNPDGSFTLTEGLYFLECGLTFADSNISRLAFRQSSNFLEVANTYAEFPAHRVPLRINKKFPSTGGTYTLQIAISRADGSIHSADVFSAGQQATVAACTINKLG